MARLIHVGALIFDLRDNRGGQPETVAFLASYLFDHPEYFYNPRKHHLRLFYSLSRPRQSPRR